MLRECKTIIGNNDRHQAPEARPGRRRKSNRIRLDGGTSVAGPTEVGPRVPELLSCSLILLPNTSKSNGNGAP